MKSFVVCPKCNTIYYELTSTKLKKHSSKIDYTKCIKCENNSDNFLKISGKLVKKSSVLFPILKKSKKK